MPDQALPARGDLSPASALQRLATGLLRAPTPAAVGRLVATMAAEMLAADAAAVYLRADQQTLEVLHTTGWPQQVTAPYRRLELVRGRPLSDAVLDGRPVWIEDRAQWQDRYPDMAPVGTTADMQASVCLPLQVEERDLGAVVFSFHGPRRFTPAEREFLLTVTALCAQGLDRARLLVSERAARAAAERQLSRVAFLARSLRLMEAPLSVEERLQRLADLAASEIADWCAVHLVVGDRVEQIAVAHSRPEKVAFVARLEQRYPPDRDSPGGPIDVSRSGRSAFFPEIPDELLVAAAQDADHLELIRSLGMRSALLVPLSVRGRSLGALTLVQAESDRRFDEADLAFAEQLAANAAVALDNARLYEQQQRTALALQNALLPGALPDVPGLRLAARYQVQTAGGSDVHVGGDLYDVVAGAAPRQWAITIADVCGKGAEAAALTALIRHTVRAEVGHGLRPADVLHRLNAAMLRENGASTRRFATVCHGLLTLVDGGARLQLASAGHPPPLLLRRGRVSPLEAPGTLAGVFGSIDLVEVTVDLEPGDMILLYTDGVTEARAGDGGSEMGGLYGTERMAALLAATPDPTPASVADALLADVLSYQDGGLRDDVAILVAQVAP